MEVLGLDEALTDQGRSHPVPLRIHDQTTVGLTGKHGLPDGPDDARKDQASDDDKEAGEHDGGS
jgi:hypothetical protein